MIDEILEFWFEGLHDGMDFNEHPDVTQKWFKKDTAFDQKISSRFKEHLLVAQDGAYDEWMKTPRGQLALIILFDQFSRNIFRDQPQAFLYDPQAMRVLKEGLQNHDDQKLQLVERKFYYMPLMHAEDRHLQEKSVHYFSLLEQEAEQHKSPNVGQYKYTVEYAVAHRDIVDRFGRFPHRNKILNRSSTVEEEEFLKQPGSSF